MRPCAWSRRSSRTTRSAAIAARRAARAAVSRAIDCAAARASAKAVRSRRRGLARMLEALRDIVARPELFERGLGAGLAFGGLVARRAGARNGLLDRRQARQGLGALALELREGVAGGVRRGARGARPPAPFRFRSGGFAGRARRARSFGARAPRPSGARPRLRAQGRRGDSFPRGAARRQSALRRRRRSRPSARDRLRARPAAGRA